MRFSKFLNFFKKKKEEKKIDPEDLPENVIAFQEFLRYRLKFNPDRKVYQKVFECQHEDLD